MIPIELTFQQIIFLCFLAAAVLALALGIAGIFYDALSVSKLLQTASGLVGISSIIQLQISGLFEKWMTEYGDAEKYPNGPPSVITRQIIDNPDFPIQSAIRDTLFFDPLTGAKLGIVSLMIAVVAAWA